MRQQRQRPRLPLHLTHQQIHQTRLDQQTRLPRWRIHRLPKTLLPHRPEQMQPPLHQPGERRIRSDIAQPVGPQRDDQLARLSMPCQLGEEACSLFGVCAQREHFLALVHHQHRSRTSDRNGGQRLHRMPPGRDDHDSAAVSPQRRRHPCPHQRRLPATGRTNHRQRVPSPKQPQAGSHIRFPTEERLRVVHVVRQQTLIGTCPAGRERTVDKQRCVLPQDRLLKRHQIRARIQPQLLDQQRLHLVKGPQRLTLTPRQILRLREQSPAPFTQRSSLHHRLRITQHPEEPARPHRRIDPQLLSLQPQLLQATSLDQRLIPALKVLERMTAPQGQCVGQEIGGTFRLTERKQLTAPHHDPLEPLGVHLVRGHDEAIPLR